MKQTYRIGVYLNENKLKISILHGCKNICNIEYLIYDIDLLLINLVKLYETYKTKFIVERNNIQIIALFKELKLLDFLYEEKPFDIKFYGTSFNQSKKEILNQLDEYHNYNKAFIESIKLAIDYEGVDYFNKLSEIRNLEKDIKYLSNKLNLLKATL